MFVVPLSAYAGYPHRTPKLALCLDSDECQDPFYAFVPEPELALSSDTGIARARYLRATEERRASRHAYADSIVLDQRRRPQKQDSPLQPRSSSVRLPHGGPCRLTRVSRTPCNYACQSSDELDRTLQVDERRLREVDEIQRRRQALMAEQAQASRMRARERAFAQALRVARKIANRSAHSKTMVSPEPSSTPQSLPKIAAKCDASAFQPARSAPRLCLTNAAPLRDDEQQRTTPESTPRGRGQINALKALELLEAEFVALPLDSSAGMRKHLLTGLLERADAVESGGCESVRCARRALVRKVQDALDSADC